MHKLERTPVLEVEDWEVTYSTREGPVRAVRGSSFEIWPGHHSVFCYVSIDDSCQGKFRSLCGEFEQGLRA